MEILKSKPVPGVVAIVAMGDSRVQYESEAIKSGSRYGVADETWVINKLAEVYHHDILFRMDDLRQVRLCNEGIIRDKDNISIHERFDKVLRNHDKPIITSTAYPEYPTSVSYPLEEVINFMGTSYFQTCPAYAVAFAAYIGVKRIKMYGCDYTYRQVTHSTETGRANLEHMLTMAMNKGVQVEVARKSTLLNTNCPPDEYFYGYGGRIIEVMPDPENKNRMKIRHREDLDTIEEIKTQKIELRKMYDYMEKFKDILEPGNPQLIKTYREKILKAGEMLVEKQDALQAQIDEKYGNGVYQKPPEPKQNPKSPQKGRSKKRTTKGK